MTSLYDVSEMLKQARRDAKLSQEALASLFGSHHEPNTHANRLTAMPPRKNHIPQAARLPGYAIKISTSATVPLSN